MKQFRYFEKHLNLNVRGLPVSATIGINELSNKLKMEGKQVYKMGLGQSPFPVPGPVIEELKANAHQKPSTIKPGIIALAIRMTTALITSKNKPRVNTVTGMVMITISGLIVTLNKARTAATNRAQKKLVTCTPGSK